MIKRSIGFVAVPLMLALAACAGAADPQADLSAGYPDAEVEPNAIPGEPLQASWPGSPFPILSFEDREAIGRVTYAEAGNQGEEGLAAVIFTILNRVNSGQFGSSVQDVIDAPNQFEPATRAGGWRYLPPLDQTQSVQFETILNLILAGWLPDLTNGALFFQNARSSRRGRREAQARPTSSTSAARRRSLRLAITASMTGAPRSISRQGAIKRTTPSQPTLLTGSGTKTARWYRSQ